LQTFSLTIQGVSQHLISYYKPEDVESGRLRSPSSIPELAALEISPEYLEKTHFRIPPRIELGRDGRPRYAGEADDDGPPSPRAALLADAPDVPRRRARADPYPTAAAGKKRRRQTDPGAPPALDLYGAPRSPGGTSPTLGSSPESAYYDTAPVPYYPASTYGYAAYAPASAGPAGAYDLPPAPAAMAAYAPAPFEGGGTYTYAGGASSYPNPYTGAWGAPQQQPSYALYGGGPAPATPRTHQGGLPAMNTSPQAQAGLPVYTGALASAGAAGASGVHGEVRRR
jgi:hypothetical protein